uniref:Myosin XIX n=1 Tax=Sphaeramia orbicularis TaxID=375764 RepID=A0A673AW96_9TELE
MNSVEDRRTVKAGHQRGTVSECITKPPLPSQSMNDPLDGDVQAFLTDEEQLHTYDDLTKVNPVTPTTVLRCLQARYRVHMFYTHAGCTLVALNPFRPVPDLYSLDVMKEYHHCPQPQVFTAAPPWTHQVHQNQNQQNRCVSVNRSPNHTSSLWQRRRTGMSRVRWSRLTSPWWSAERVERERRGHLAV